MKSHAIVVVVFVALLLAACPPREVVLPPEESPLPVLVMPVAGTAVGGLVLVGGENRRPGFDPRRLNARFEFSGDGTAWQPVAELRGQLASVHAENYEWFTALWDTRDLAPGPYSLRVGMQGGRAAWTWSDPVAVEVGRPTGGGPGDGIDCVCKRIDLRGDDPAAESTAYGPDGRPGGAVWSAYGDRFDGSTLGPLATNPANPDAEGDHRTIGVALEVVAEVEGDPTACRTGQHVRGSFVRCDLSVSGCRHLDGRWLEEQGCCSFASPWRGTVADLDQDGLADINLTDGRECRDAGGSWSRKECRKGFGRWSPGFKPDAFQGGRSLYDEPFTYLAHAGNRISWANVVGSTGGRARGEVRYVSYVRGTDGSYCYVKYDISYRRKEGEDFEALREVEHRIGSLAVPTR